MPIPINVIYGLFGILGGVSVLAFIFSWSVAHGFEFRSCRGDSSCGCDGHKHGKTAEKILSLIEK